MKDKCDFCGTLFRKKPHSIQTNRKTGVKLYLCLKGCRWFPEAYPTREWEDWEEEIIRPWKGGVRKSENKSISFAEINLSITWLSLIHI